MAKQHRELALDVMQNMPEYGYGAYNGNICTKWDYEKGEYTFNYISEEDETVTKEIVLNADMLEKAMEKLILMMVQGKYRFCGCDFLNGDPIMDGACWDAICVDALVQVAIFGDVIYG